MIGFGWYYDHNKDAHVFNQVYYPTATDALECIFEHDNFAVCLYRSGKLSVSVQPAWVRNQWGYERTIQQEPPQDKKGWLPVWVVQLGVRSR